MGAPGSEPIKETHTLCREASGPSATAGPPRPPRPGRRDGPVRRHLAPPGPPRFRSTMAPSKGRVFGEAITGGPILRRSGERDPLNEEVTTVIKIMARPILILSVGLGSARVGPSPPSTLGGGKSVPPTLTGVVPTVAPGPGPRSPLPRRDAEWVYGGVKVRLTVTENGVDLDTRSRKGRKGGVRETGTQRESPV